MAETVQRRRRQNTAESCSIIATQHHLSSTPVNSARSGDKNCSWKRSLSACIAKCTECMRLLSDADKILQGVHFHEQETESQQQDLQQKRSSRKGSPADTNFGRINCFRAAFLRLNERLYSVVSYVERAIIYALHIESPLRFLFTVDESLIITNRRRISPQQA